VDYREYQPHAAALRPFIRTYWSLCGCSREALPQPVLPDGTTELVVHRERPWCSFPAAWRKSRQCAFDPRPQGREALFSTRFFAFFAFFAFIV
jgi:hypothetical protein